MKGTIHTLYFSPTHTSETTAKAIATAMAGRLELEATSLNLTAPHAREGEHSFGREDILIFAFPVYGGRIPAMLEPCMKQLHGNGTPAVIAAVYGNRDYDDALLEAADLLSAQGFVPAAAGAFIGEHSFSYKLAAGRPNDADLDAAAHFGVMAADKISAAASADGSGVSGESGRLTPAQIPGNRPYKERGPAMAAAPLTREACTHCMICVEGCPMGIIHADDPSQVDAGCLRCFACVKSCPVHAKYFDNERIAQATAMLESKFADPKEPVFFL